MYLSISSSSRVCNWADTHRSSKPPAAPLSATKLHRFNSPQRELLALDRSSSCITKVSSSSTTATASSSTDLQKSVQRPCSILQQPQRKPSSFPENWAPSQNNWAPKLRGSAAARKCEESKNRNYVRSPESQSMSHQGEPKSSQLGGEKQKFWEKWRSAGRVQCIQQRKSRSASGDPAMGRWFLGRKELAPPLSCRNGSDNLGLQRSCSVSAEPLPPTESVIIHCRRVSSISSIETPLAGGCRPYHPSAMRSSSLRWCVHTGWHWISGLTLALVVIFLERDLIPTRVGTTIPSNEVIPGQVKAFCERMEGM